MEQCKHEWVYSNSVLMSNPPIYKKICRLCGEEEYERKEVKREETYEQIQERFKIGEK